MGAIAPIDVEKCLFAPIDFDKKAYCNHHLLSLMGENLLFITSLHPSIKNPKEGPDYVIEYYMPKVLEFEKNLLMKNSICFNIAEPIII